ncbi:hypothetical protein PYW07_008425 [Mythimna separata]|uniref:SURP motif domain-containing protein n=1 Tax=Mythimna separata TaxID=271217 RepID=A0AAD8DNP8_MYTSE|nr:hypothetical protein PYW07_008425 [Mythimna separata]
MSLKWTGSQSDSGILRKSDFKEKKEDLFVFGYSCKLFRDDDKALHIDQGKHLIPWMGDETLKIDRYDARGALHDLTRLEAPPGGYDWRVELTRGELDVEQLCDDERYRALHTDEDEEEMYKEEELKRLHAAGYGQVGFNYDAPAEPDPPPLPAEVDEEPFIPSPAFRALLPIDIVFPESLKQNAIIEKTAKFIASQGAQMEILIKAKQGDNAQFQFLNRESNLHAYYTALIGLVKAEKWPEKKIEVVEEKQPENEEYLHPSLASTVIESAPAIPSIHYKPSADCDYTMLISKMRGEGEGETEEPRGDVPPPGTEPPRDRSVAAEIYRAPVMYTKGPDGNHVDPTAPPPPNAANYQQYAAYYHQYLAQEQQSQHNQAPSLKSTGLSLMKNYNTDSDSDVSDFDDSSSTDSRDKPSIVTPPEDVQIVIDKMASYVARNGDEFADIVRAKNDPRFTFLHPENVYHAYYKRLMQLKRGIDVNGKEKKKRTAAPVSFSIKKLKEPDPILPKPALPYESSSDDDSEKPSEKQPQEEVKELPKIYPQTIPMNCIPPVVMYKIDPQYNNEPLARTVYNIEPVKPVKMALPPIIMPEVKELPKQEEPVVMTPELSYTPAIQEAQENPFINENVAVTDKMQLVMQREQEILRKREEAKKMESPPKSESPHKADSPRKMESPPKSPLNRESPYVRESPHLRESPRRRDSPRRSPSKRESSYKRESPQKRENSHKRESPHVRGSPHLRERDRENSHKRDKKKHRDRKKEHRSKSESRDSRRNERRSADREKKRDKDKMKEGERESKRVKHSKDELENEIISLEDNSDDLIDLTGEQSDSKGEGETEAERAKQQERRRRAAEFLKKVGVDPAAAALPTSSLASAMVDTLESIRKKKAEEEEKRRRRDKRRHRDRRDYEDESERSHRKSKRRKYKSSDENYESDYDGSKKKKRKKERKHSSKNKRKRSRPDGDEEQPIAVNIDLTSTLKELRTSSPTKELVLQDLEDTQHSFSRKDSSDDELGRDRRRKKERYYSEGEWSSDSEGDSNSSGSRKDE